MGYWRDYFDISGDARRRAEARRDWRRRHDAKHGRKPISPGGWLAIAIVVGVLAVIGLIANSVTSNQASAAGCIDAGSVPSWYISPDSGAALDKCNSLSGTYVPRVGCTVTMSDDPARGTGGCSFGEKPQAVP